MCISEYNGISIKRTHHKTDTSTRRTVWRGTDWSALRSNYLRKYFYKADISIKRTLFLLQWCPLYRDSTVSLSNVFWTALFFILWENAFNNYLVSDLPVDIRLKLNVRETFMWQTGSHLNALCSFNLSRLSTGFMPQIGKIRYN